MSDGPKSAPERIAFIGFGEAAQAFTGGWRLEADLDVSAYDIKTDDPKTANAKRDDYRQHGVRGLMSAAELASQANVIVSAVTADAILDAARSVAATLGPNHLYLDINSAAPARKRLAADIIGAGGAQYVDVAVMAPVHPNLHRTPLLIGGPGAERIEPFLEDLNMKFEIVSQKVGDASTIKMVRSVMIKGIESLTAECVLAAVKAGIDARILDSLESSFPGMDWRARAGYMLGRIVEHGTRRAAEMREVAATLDDLGVGGTMAAATADRQQWVADLDIAEEFKDGTPDDYHVLAKAILAHLEVGGGREEN
jgi:3-hydroxyisobutyrate dehydrogenase-like beta-hydroxyacid dehydrogenase